MVTSLQAPYSPIAPAVSYKSSVHNLLVGEVVHPLLTTNTNLDQEIKDIEEVMLESKKEQKTTPTPKWVFFFESSLAFVFLPFPLLYWFTSLFKIMYWNCKSYENLRVIIHAKNLMKRFKPKYLCLVESIANKNRITHFCRPFDNH